MTLSPATAAAAASLLLAIGSGVAAAMWPREAAARRARIDALIGEPAAAAASGAITERWYHRLGRAVSLSPVIGRQESRKLAALLTHAGFRQRGALASFVAIKTIGLVAALILVWRLLGPWLADKGGPALIAGGVLGAGIFAWRVPDLAAVWLARRRVRVIEDGLPDALDLMVICAEAGLSLDQSLERVARELAGANAPLAEEIAMTAAEMRILADRFRALDNLVARVGLRSLGSIVATLGQALRYGTPLAQSFRIISGEIRSARTLAIEARAARLPVLLTIPLILFILPSLFLVIAGPAALDVWHLLHK
jgi:tight adherence protein C